MAPWLRAFCAVGLWLGLVACGQAQTAPTPQTPAPSLPTPSPAVISGVLIIDQERLFSESRYGGQVKADLDRASALISAQNRKTEQALATEEQALTRKRTTLAPDAFRVLAYDFDARVTALRQESDRTERGLAAWREREQQIFLQAIVPVLGELLQENGADAILDKQSVFLYSERIDVTDRAIARIDARLSDAGLFPDSAALNALAADPQTAKP